MSTIDVAAIARRIERRTDLLVGWVCGIVMAGSFFFSVMSAVTGAYISAGVGAATALTFVWIYAMRIREIDRS